jgi:methionyl-tRNA formyltransferase
MRIGVIVDHGRVARWQADALAALPADWEFELYSCSNSLSRRRPVRHGLYYLLNIVSLRGPATAPAPLPQSLRILGRRDFASEWDGAWQRLPGDLLDEIRSSQPAAILKFGMGLLRIPPELPCPILSYHHGDPRKFRGRPAGFWELLQDESAVGQVVQILSDRLDAGPVVAYAETKALAHDYRATMAAAYAASPLILLQAIDNAVRGRVHSLEPSGRTHRLPSNATVLRFAAQRLSAKLRRLAYGITAEKAWQVAEAPLSQRSVLRLLAGFPDPPEWNVLPCPSRYRFLADPFFDPRDGAILAEALRKTDEQGEIVRLDRNGAQVVATGPGHFSYPATASNGSRHFLLPEISDWSSPKLFLLDGVEAQPLHELDLPGRPRVLDPTLHSDGDHFYLFGNCAEEGPDVLRLWVARAIEGPFSEHPESPVRISPAGSRMAGSLLALEDGLFRPGQDLRRGYGHGVLLFRIREITPTGYFEEEVGSIAFEAIKGPHTINYRDGRLLFDFYRERLTAAAGLRRLKALLVRRSVQNG